MKMKLIEQLLRRLEAELGALEASTAAANEAATHPDAKAENKYDTRGLEASYLAGAQKERLAELQGIIESLRASPVRIFGDDDPIGAGALVELDQAGTRSLCFLVRAGAGFELDGDGGRKALTVTINSPLGKALLGKRCGEFATIRTAAGEKDYEILTVW
jgi:transcription elongation GreA/GreB family factor